MGKCQSHPRDSAVSNEVPVAALLTAETSATIEEPTVVEKPCITTKALREMPENVIELDENEQTSIFSKLLVKNLIEQGSAAAEQDEREEEMEIKSQALALIKQVIQEGCQKISAEEEQEMEIKSQALALIQQVIQEGCQKISAEEEQEMEIKSQALALVKQVVQAGCQTISAEEDEQDEDMEIKSQAMTLIKQVIQDGCQKIAGQQNVPAAAEDKAQTLKDSSVLAEEKAEVKTSGDSIPVTNDVNMTEVKVVVNPCPKCKGTGKTNLMGGTRGLSFMKRQCKYCSSATAAQAAKAGA